MDQRPIGVFDSGVGGLTVAKEIMRQLPNEKIIYFGDTARVPYGSKSKETIIKYSRQDIRFLMTKGIKAIIIACGTASTNSLEVVQQEFDIPIIGVVQPGATAAAYTTNNKKIGIIATEASIRSETYHALIQEFDADIKVYGQPCPLFVPLVEEGWIDEEVTFIVAQKYLRALKDEEVDTLVLGCTHYPLLENIIGDIMGDQVALVNPALEAAKTLKEQLKERNGLREDKELPDHEFYVSDNTKKFQQIAEMILEHPMKPVEQINIEEY